MKTSKCWGQREIPVAIPVVSEIRKAFSLADVLSQLSSAKYADSCLVFVLTLLALVENKRIEKKREHTMS